MDVHEEQFHYRTDIYLWGKNHFGQLGIPSSKASKQKKEAHGDADGMVSQEDLQSKFDDQQYFAPLVASLDMPIKQISCGEEHTVILTDQGQVYTMGSNSYGQVGVPVTKGATRSQASSMKDMETSSNATEQSRQILDQNKYFEPILISLPDKTANKIVKVACGEQHTLALNKRGQVYSWGQARYGALGIDFNL